MGLRVKHPQRLQRQVQHLVGELFREGRHPVQGVADRGCGGHELFEHRPRQAPCTRVLIHSLGWLSMALHTSLVRAWWGAKEGTARRRRWHASGDRVGCGASTVIHLQAVSGTIAGHFHGNHALGGE